MSYFITLFWLMNISFKNPTVVHWKFNSDQNKFEDRYQNPNNAYKISIYSYVGAFYASLCPI